MSANLPGSLESVKFFCFRFCLISGLSLALLGNSSTASAQIGRFLDRVQDSVERQVDQAVNRTTGGVEGAITETVSCTLGNSRCLEEAQSSGQVVVIVDDDGQTINDSSGNPVTTMAEAEAMQAQPGEGIWRNYDFIPGKRVMFASDWGRARVGRIPQDIRFISGNMQIVEISGKNVLEITSNSAFEVLLDEPLPESFSLEFEGQSSRLNVGTNVYFEPYTEPGYAYQTYPNNYLHLRGGESGIQIQNSFVSSMANLRHVAEELVPVKFQYDYGYAIMYVGTDRAAQIPNATIPSGSAIEFKINANADYPAYIADIVIAYDIDDPYSTLMDAGEFTTRGILFDSGQSRLRPESTTTLILIEDMLKDHDDLSIIIEGHTDSQGDDDSNMALSQARADAVKTWLVSTGISESRLATQGYGEQQPVSDNGSEAGRQQNRRVVLRLN